MNRRDRIIGGRRSSPRVFSPLSLPGLAHWYKSEVTLSGGNVTDWIDKVGSDDLSEATNPPSWNTSDSDFGGQSSITFTEASLEFLQGSSTTAWNAGHDGTGCTLYVTIRFGTSTTTAQPIIDNANYTNTTPGFFLRYSGDTDTLQVFVSNGTSFIVNDSGSVADETAGTLVYRYSESASPEYDVRFAGSSIASGSTSGAPSSGDAAWAATVGRRANSSAKFLDGKIAEIAFYNEYHSISQVERWEAYAA